MANPTKSLVLLLGFAHLPHLPAQTTPIDVTTQGVSGDGTTNDSPALQRLVATSLHRTLFFPHGTYVLHNRGHDTPGLTLRNYSGTLRMAAGARFACDTATTEAGQCVWLIGAKNVTFDGMTITYLAANKLPLKRNSAIANALLIEDSSNVTLHDITILGSTGSGIWNTNSMHITYTGTTRITQTTADGIHFENVGSSSLTNLITNDTGDDGLGVTNIATNSPNCGLKVDGAHIQTSHSRGIATAGACDASFENVVIEGTANSGIATTQDESIHSRASSHVRFAQVTIFGAGSVNGIPGNPHCIDIGASRFVTVQNITCSRLDEGGAFVYGGSTDVELRDVTMDGPKGNGFQVAGAERVVFLNDRVSHATGDGFDVQDTRHATLSDCTIDGAGGYGFYHSGSADVNESNLRVRNAAGSTGNNRAWWAENMKGSTVSAGLTVIDDQPKATGYVVGDYANAGYALAVWDISFQLTHGEPSIRAGGRTSMYQLAGSPRP